MNNPAVVNLSKNASDNEVIELAKKDPDVFGELVNRYYDRLFFYIRKISYFGKEDIEDILQEVFIKVYKNLNSFDSDLKFSSWIYQIVRNTTIDAIRVKHARPQSANLENEELVKLFRSGTDIENEIIMKDNLEKIKKIIGGLPFVYQEVLILKFLEEKNYDEIMDIIKKPKGTVASLINRGRKILMDEARKNNLVLSK